jgi:hypothetical protein
MYLKTKHRLREVGRIICEVQRLIDAAQERHLACIGGDPRLYRFIVDNNILLTGLHAAMLRLETSRTLLRMLILTTQLSTSVSKGI